MKTNLCRIITFLALAAGGVTSFTPSPKRSAASGNNILNNNGHQFSSPKSTAVTPRTVSPASRAPTALAALPTWTYYSIGHVFGGNIGVPFVVGATKSWYNRIPLPSWIPPNFLFAPVWTVLYSLMGVSVSRIVKSGAPTSSFATKLWAFHYALNVLWPPIFFGLKFLRLGLIINISLVLTLGAILPIFYRIDPLAAYLLIPYFLWLLFATKLNQAICELNPTLDGVNGAKIEADICFSGKDEYTDDKLQYEIKKLQVAAKKYAGL